MRSRSHQVLQAYMQQHNLNLRSLPNKSLGTATDSKQRLIKLEQAPAYCHSKHHLADGYASQGDRDSHRTQTSEILAKLIGSHRIHSIAPATDCRLDYTHHPIASNFQMLDVEWQGAFQLEQDPLDNRYIIYLVLAGSLAQKIDSPQRLAILSCRTLTVGFPDRGAPLSQLYGREIRPHCAAPVGFPSREPRRTDHGSKHQTVCCEPNTATMISPGQKLESIASQEGKALLIAIDRDSIDLALSKLLNRPLKQPVIFLPSIDLTSELGLSLKKLLQFLWESTHSTETAAASLVMQKLEQAFLACVVEGLPSNYTEELLYQTDGALAGHVRKARAFIESHLHEDIKLGDIAAATKVCSRLLQKAFSHHCGCSPMRFVTQARLERIRQALEAAPSDTKIVDVMMQYGFTQGGKFAKEYQQLFGEKPSETLKRCSQLSATNAKSPLWQQIDDPRSERVVGGANSSNQSVVTAGIQDTWGLLARLRYFLT